MSRPPVERYNTSCRNSAFSLPFRMKHAVDISDAWISVWMSLELICVRTSRSGKRNRKKISSRFRVCVCISTARILVVNPFDPRERNKSKSNDMYCTRCNFDIVYFRCKRKCERKERKRRCIVFCKVVRAMVIRL